MANNISWEKIVGEKTIENGGYAGDLLQLIFAHLDKAREDGDLTDEQVGLVYSNSIGIALGKAMEFEFQEKTIEKTLIRQDLENENRQKQNELAEVTIDKAMADALSAKEIFKQNELKTKIIDNKEKRDQAFFSETLENMKIEQEQKQINIENAKSVIKIREEQAIDNRYIKTIEKLGNMLGATMNGGLLPDKSMLQAFFNYIAKLNGVRTVYIDTISATSDNTDLIFADNSGVKYPYGGKQEYGEQDNIFVANYYIFKNDSSSEHTFGNSDSSISIIAKKGDMIMQSGTPENPKWIHIPMKVDQQSFEE